VTTVKTGLRVLKLVSRRGPRMALCQCECGRQFSVLLSDVQAGRVLACSECQPTPLRPAAVIPAKTPDAPVELPHLSGEELSTFGFVLSTANGRPEFETNIKQLALRTNCSRSRLQELLGRLADKNLIALGDASAPGSVAIGIVVDPRWRLRQLRDGEKWVIPLPHSRDAE
jgi:hypothetical protein